MPACLFCIVLRVARTSSVFVDIEARVVSAVPPVASPNLDGSSSPSTVHSEKGFVLLRYCNGGFTTVNRVAGVVHGGGGGWGRGVIGLAAGGWPVSDGGVGVEGDPHRDASSQ
jgi:hypothetical protein